MIASTESSKQFTSIDEFEIANTLFGCESFPFRFCSPIRDDKNPSCCLYLSNGRIRFKDFSTGEYYSFTDLLLKIYNCEFSQLRDAIQTNLNIKSETKEIVKTNVVKHDKFKLDYIEREWNNNDKEYWNSYGVTIDYLIKSNVVPISQIIYDYPKLKKKYLAEELAYAFIEHKDGIKTIKIYQPKADSKNKWRNDHNSSVIQLWNTLPKKGNRLIICSSLKDSLCLTCNTGIPSIAPQSETTYIKSKVIDELCSRFDYVYVCFDTDKAGRMNENKMCEGTSMIPFNLPEFIGGKDVSDYYKVFGKNAFVNMINKQLINLNNDW